MIISEFKRRLQEIDFHPDDTVTVLALGEQFEIADIEYEDLGDDAVVWIKVE